MSPASRSCTIKMFLPVGDMGAGCLGLRIAPWTGFDNLARPSMSTSGSFLPEKVIAWCFQKLDWQAVCRWKYSCQVQICDRVRISHSTPIRCEECVCWALQTTNSTQRPGSPKNTTQHHDVSVQSTLDRRPMYYSQKQKWTRRVRMQTQ